MGDFFENVLQQLFTVDEVSEEEGRKEGNPVACF